MLTSAERAAIISFRANQVDEADTVFGPAIDAANSTAAAQPVLLSSYVTMSFLLPDAATSTYLYTVPDKCEIIDVTCIKDGAGAANTVQLTNNAGTAISDAIATAVDKTVTRAGTLDKTTRVLAAGDTLKIVNTRAAGTAACAVFVRAIRRV
jgi:hypothetical protein